MSEILLQLYNVLVIFCQLWTYHSLQTKTVEQSVKLVTFARSKLKFFKSRQAIFIYVTMFYLMFMFLHKPKFVPGAEFSNNKERCSTKRFNIPRTCAGEIQQKDSSYSRLKERLLNHLVRKA